MKTSKFTSILTVVVIAVLFSSPAAAKKHRNLVLLLEGSNVQGYESLVPDIDGDGVDDGGFCFDANLRSARSNRIVGTATECLSPLGPNGLTYATTTFNFRWGSFTSRGKITIQPVQWDPADNPDVDESVGAVTGYFPAPGTNNIVRSSGWFRNAMGRVRLSGAALDFGDGTANLNCLFIVDFY